MKCSTGPLIAAIVATSLLVASAIALVVAAIYFNGIIITAVAAVPLLFAAAGVTFGASAAAAALASIMFAFVECLRRNNPRPPSGAPAGTITVDQPICSAELSNWMNSVAAIASMLLVQSAACARLAGWAFIPWAPQTSMYIIVGTLGVIVVMLGVLIGFSVSLQNCLTKHLPN